MIRSKPPYVCSDCGAIFSVAIRNRSELLKYGDPTRFCPVCGSSDVEVETYVEDATSYVRYDDVDDLPIEYYDDEDSVDRY